MFDEEDVIRRANELADFVAAAAEQYNFDAADVTAVGYSNGANIAAAMTLLRPMVLRSAALLRAMMPLSNPALPDLSGKRVLLLAGDTDPIIPAPNVQQLAAVLQLSGAEVRIEIQRAGHGLVPADFSITKQWLRSAV